MNAVTDFFVRQIVAVYFFYGLAFFVMGLALLFVGRRTSQLRFALAVVPLAAFGLLHATHEWYEMFQKIGASPARRPLHRRPEWSKNQSACFCSPLRLSPCWSSPWCCSPAPARRAAASICPCWLSCCSGLSARSCSPSAFSLLPLPAIGLADSLARYAIGIPAALLGVWALMAQQRIFREQDMPQYGRDLVWAAAALLLYGVIGQIFVKESILFPSHLFSQANFLDLVWHPGPALPCPYGGCADLLSPACPARL